MVPWGAALASAAAITRSPAEKRAVEAAAASHSSWSQDKLRSTSHPCNLDTRTAISMSEHTSPPSLLPPFLRPSLPPLALDAPTPEPPLRLQAIDESALAALVQSKPQ